MRKKSAPLRPAKVFIGVSVTAAHSLVHLRIEDGKRVFLSALSPEAAQGLGLKLLEGAADARAMTSFRDMLLSDHLGEDDRLPLGAVRKILHAMAQGLETPEEKP